MNVKYRKIILDLIPDVPRSDIRYVRISVRVVEIHNYNDIETEREMGKMIVGIHDVERVVLHTRRKYRIPNESKYLINNVPNLSFTGLKFSDAKK